MEEVEEWVSFSECAPRRGIHDSRPRRLAAGHGRPVSETKEQLGGYDVGGGDEREQAVETATELVELLSEPWRTVEVSPLAAAVHSAAARSS